MTSEYKNNIDKITNSSIHPAIAKIQNILYSGFFLKSIYTNSALRDLSVNMNAEKT